MCADVSTIYDKENNKLTIKATNKYLHYYKFPHAKYIVFKLTETVNLEGHVFFPDTVEKIKIFSNKLYGIGEYIHLPEKLKTLIIDYIHPSFELPDTLENLTFTDFYDDTSTLKLPKYLKNLTLLDEDGHDISSLILPDSLETLTILNLTTSLTNLPTTLKKLTIKEFDFPYSKKKFLDNSKIPFGCEVILETEEDCYL